MGHRWHLNLRSSPFVISVDLIRMRSLRVDFGRGSSINSAELDLDALESGDDDGGAAKVNRLGIVGVRQSGGFVHG